MQSIQVHLDLGATLADFIARQVNMSEVTKLEILFFLTELSSSTVELGLPLMMKRQMLISLYSTQVYPILTNL